MAAPSQLVGHTLSHYRILEQIGAGGMGVVYRAHDERLERAVAIKVLPVGTLADESARRRFRKEALTLSKLSHPNIATVHDFDFQAGVDFLVTEYISGLTLDAKLAEGALPEKEVIGLGIQLSEGLNAAHQQDIVHRDLKPANLRLTSDGRLKILDFGLAQLMPHASEIGLTATLTQSQQVTGTLPYMAPEQLRGEPAEARTDIWAAGAVLYEMATGHRPFEQKVPSALIDDIIHKPPPPLRRLRSELSPKLEAVILKCLEKEQGRRYQSARELQSDLERLGTGVTPNAARRRLRPIIATSAIVVVMLAVGAFFYLRRSPKLTEKDTIVLADFANSTGDPVFDDTLKQALAVDLEQSPFLNILSDRAMAEALRLMGRRPGDKFAQDLAREVCQRVGSKAVLGGSIANLGSQYVIGLKAVNCQTGDTLVEEQTRAKGKDELLKQLDKAVSELRGKLGESLGSIRKFETPLEQATTPSFEALKAYSLGRKAFSEEGDAAAIPFFRHAIEFDPNFALAYASLGNSEFNLLETRLASEDIQKAWELRDRVSERERFRISAFYYTFVTEELEKANQIYELWARTYPRDDAPHLYLGLSYAFVGKYEKAVAETLEDLRLNPIDGLGYGNLMSYYVYLNRLDEAKDTYERALSRNIDTLILRSNRYALAFFQKDLAEMERQVTWALGKPGVEDFLFSFQSDTEAFSGRLGKAREFSRRAVESAQRHGRKETAADWQMNAALREAEFGNMKRARQETIAALALASTRDVQTVAALALARAGDSARAQSMADELAARFPLNSVLNSYWLPAVRAAIEINRGNPARAIERLQAAATYELGYPFPQIEDGALLYSVYVRGQAYLQLHRGSEAAVEFQKFLDHSGAVVNCPLGALAHLGLGRAYALSGDTAKARTAYQDFLALWKDADPTIPILKEAKAEYAKLQ